MKVIACTIALFAVSGCRFHQSPAPLRNETAAGGVLRAHRIELTDESGKMRAIVGFRSGSSEPEVTLLDESSQPAVMLQVDKRGQATMDFSDPNGRNGGQIAGRVAVGYLWGSDCCYKPGEYDPSGSWGVRILTKDRNGYLAVHDLVLADPNERDLRNFASPVRVPLAGNPVQIVHSQAHRR